MAITGTTREFIVHLENQPGTLAKLAQLLGKEDINILGYAALAHDDVGTLHLITDDEEQAEVVLEQAGYAPQVRDAIIVSVDNEPGELGRVAHHLAHHGINIEASFAASSADGGDLRIALAVADAAGAQKALEGLD